MNDYAFNNNIMKVYTFYNVLNVKLKPNLKRRFDANG